jgi:hypothetical protein
MSLLDKASLIVTPNAYKTSKLYSVVPSTGTGDMDVVRATTATRVNSAGLIESAGVNVPRIDYTNGSCPSLLVEPQRTNLYFPSIPNNSGGGTLTANAAVSPGGVQNASSFLPSGSGLVWSDAITTTSQNYTYTVYLKGTANGQKVRLSTNTTTLTDFTLTASWKRYSFTFLANSETTPYYILSGSFFSPAENNLFYIWGAQLEAGSYPTSYIPTVASTVTRNADVISKTGISSLIGTEFTLFFDGYETIGGNSSRYIVLKGSGGLYANAVLLESNASNRIVLTVLNSSSATVFGSFSGTLTNGQRIKLAVRCKNNDFAFYVNGALIGSQASGTVPTTSDLYLGYYTDYADNYNKINSAVVFNSALSNTELAQLTTI